MVVRRPRANVTFHPEKFEALETAAALTGLSVSHIVDQFMSAHLSELNEFNRWFKRQKSEEMRIRAVHSLEQYGPRDLIADIQDIDPTYQPPASRLMDAADTFLDDEELADLRDMLADWKKKKARQ